MHLIYDSQEAIEYIKDQGLFDEYADKETITGKNNIIHRRNLIDHSGRIGMSQFT